MPVNVGKATDVGRVRDLNEDCATVAQVWPSSAISATPVVLAAVADGMGGHAAGDVASRIAVDAFVRTALADLSVSAGSSTALVNATERAFKVANAEVYRRGQADAKQAGMGTTLTTAIIDGSAVCIGHVGDSRAYLLRNGTFRRLTKDHSRVQEKLDAGLITPREARRSQERNVLRRVVGVQPQVASDLFAEQLEEGDVILLCTDGLHNSCADEELAEAVRLHSDPQAVCEHLMQQANDRDGSDNITAVCLQVGGKRAATRVPIRSRQRTTSRHVVSSILYQLQRLRDTASASRRSHGILPWMLGGVLLLILLVIGQIRGNMGGSMIDSRLYGGAKVGGAIAEQIKGLPELHVSFKVVDGNLTLSANGTKPFLVTVGNALKLTVENSVTRSINLTKTYDVGDQQEVEFAVHTRPGNRVALELRRSPGNYPTNHGLWADGNRIRSNVAADPNSNGYSISTAETSTPVSRVKFFLKGTPDDVPIIIEFYRNAETGGPSTTPIKSPSKRSWRWPLGHRKNTAPKDKDISSNVSPSLPSKSGLEKPEGNPTGEQPLMPSGDRIHFPKNPRSPHNDKLSLYSDSKQDGARQGGNQ